MTADRFSDRSPGRLVPATFAKPVAKPSGVFETIALPTVAFEPHPLPPDVDWREIKADLFDELDSATSALATINGLVPLAPNTRMLRHALWMREAKLSSEIENIHTTALDMVLAGSRAPSRERAPGLEVWNAMRAVFTALDSDLPFSGRLLRQMHAVLFSGLESSSVRAGEYRDVQVIIGSEDRPERARFVPPPPGRLPGQVDECMARLEEFANADWSSIPPLACVAMTHYQFETIHPFRDGNGRVGRALILHQLCRRGLLDLPVVFVSGFLKRNRQQYVDRMFLVSANGDWKGWIEFFVRAVRDQAIETRILAQRLIHLHRTWSEMIRSHKAPVRLLTLVDKLFEHPIATARGVVELLGVTDPTARNDIATLEDLGVLRIVENVAYGKTWYAPDILAIVDATDQEIDDASA